MKLATFASFLLGWRICFCADNIHDDDGPVCLLPASSHPFSIGKMIKSVVGEEKMWSNAKSRRRPRLFSFVMLSYLILSVSRAAVSSPSLNASLSLFFIIKRSTVVYKTDLLFIRSSFLPFLTFFQSFWDRLIIIDDEKSPKCSVEP